MFLLFSPLLLAASWAYSISDCCLDGWMCVIKRFFYIAIPPPVFLWFLRNLANLAHTIYVPLRTKLEQIFEILLSNCFANSWNFFQIALLLLELLSDSRKTSPHVYLDVRSTGVLLIGPFVLEGCSLAASWPATSINMSRQSLKTYLFNNYSDWLRFILHRHVLCILRFRHRTRCHDSFCLASMFEMSVYLFNKLIAFTTSSKGKGKGLDTCYSATYMSQTRDQQRFTISEVAADWHKPMVLQRIMWPSIAHANGQLDPRCS